MSGHAIEWEWAGGTIDATAVCLEPKDADCRLSCPEGCEVWGQIIRKDGMPWHTIPGGVIPIHRMEVVPYCNVVEFLNADPYMLPELAVSDVKRFTIARTPIVPVWGDDCYEWRPPRHD